MIVLGVSLGNWQGGRALEKQAVRDRLEAMRREPPANLGAQPGEAAVLELRSVVARGQWLPERRIYIDNRVRNRLPGYHVVMPLRIEGTAMHVLVNRGWMPAAPTRGEPAPVATPPGTVEISGTARIPPASPFRLGTATEEGRVWQNLELARYRAWSGLALQPVVIEQTSAADDGLVREWPAPDLGIDKHRGYALQWYALALLAAVLLVVFSRRRRPRDEA